MRSLASILILVMVACAPARAELKWDSQKLELSPSAIDASADAKFGFVNAGTMPVTIEAVQSSCGCMVPALAKKTYAPGERGEISARFNIGDRRGVQNKTIRVGVQGERDPTLLTLVVNIPDPVRITPAILAWERGEPSTPKTITVQAQPNQPVRVLKVTATHPNMDARVETIKESAEYRITVTPKSTDTPGFVLLTIDTLLMGQPRAFSSYLQIKPPAR